MRDCICWMSLKLLIFLLREGFLKGSEILQPGAEIALFVILTQCCRKR